MRLTNFHIKYQSEAEEDRTNVLMNPNTIRGIKPDGFNIPGPRKQRKDVIADTGA